MSYKISLRTLLSMLEDVGGACIYCRKKLTASNATLEHIIPRSWNGKKQGSNVSLACQRCNGTKANLEAMTRAEMPEGERPDLSELCARFVTMAMSLGSAPQRKESAYIKMGEEVLLRANVVCGTTRR